MTLRQRLAIVLLLPCGLCAAPAAAAPDALPRIRLERFLTLDKPVYLTTDPAGRLFVVEQTGRVLLLGDGKTPNKTPYLDLRKSVYVEYECGLLSIAFHPKFAENGLLYL